MKVWCMFLLGSIMSRRTVFMLCIMQAAGYDLDRRVHPGGECLDVFATACAGFVTTCGL